MLESSRWAHRSRVRPSTRLTFVRLHGYEYDAWNADGRPDGYAGDGTGHPDPFTALANRYPEPALLHAHSHVQFEVERDGTTFANPGSVGAQRLGEPLVCYAILENGDLSYHATPYDVEQTCAAMDELPIDPAFVEKWKEAYRSGSVPVRYGIRDFGPLREEGAFL